MGLLDNIKNGIAEKQESQRQERERKRELQIRAQEEQRQIQLKLQECNRDRSLSIYPTFGHIELGLPSPVVIRQKSDGSVYFGLRDEDMYHLIGYEWNGPMYNQVVFAQANTNANTNQNYASQTVKKGKSGRMAAGAIIGTVLMPGVGTAVGAAIGAGGKSKQKTTGNSTANTYSNSNSQQISKNVEQNTTAIIRLKRISDNTVHSLTVVCNTGIDAQLRCFNIWEEKSITDASMNATESLKGIKALKELLDMGAITQEEFDAKKNQMLNL